MSPLPDQKTIDDIILRITVEEKHKALIFVKREDVAESLKLSQVVLDAIDAKLLRLKYSPNLDCELVIVGIREGEPRGEAIDDICRKA